MWKVWLVGRVRWKVVGSGMVSNRLCAKHSLTPVQISLCYFSKDKSLQVRSAVNLLRAPHHRKRINCHVTCWRYRKNIQYLSEMKCHHAAVERERDREIQQARPSAWSFSPTFFSPLRLIYTHTHVHVHLPAWVWKQTQHVQVCKIIFLLNTICNYSTGEMLEQFVCLYVCVCACVCVKVSIFCLCTFAYIVKPY